MLEKTRLFRGKKVNVWCVVLPVLLEIGLIGALALRLYNSKVMILFRDKSPAGRQVQKGGSGDQHSHHYCPDCGTQN